MSRYAFVLKVDDRVINYRESTPEQDREDAGLVFGGNGYLDFQRSCKELVTSLKNAREHAAAIVREGKRLEYLSEFFDLSEMKRLAISQITATISDLDYDKDIDLTR